MKDHHAQEQTQKENVWYPLDDLQSKGAEGVRSVWGINNELHSLLKNHAQIHSSVAICL